MFTIEKSVSPSGAFVAVLSTKSIDRQGERVMPDAFAPFKNQKRPLLVAHRDGLPVGSAYVADVQSDRVIAKGQVFLTHSEAPATIAAMQAGVVGLSYRAQVAPGGASMKSGVREVHRLATLDELTITAMPANGDTFGTFSVTKSAAQEIAKLFADGGHTATGGFAIPEVTKSLTDGIAPPGIVRESTRMATTLDRDPAWPRFVDLYDSAVTIGSAAWGLSVSDGHRSTASTAEGAASPDVSPEFTLASVGSLKWHVARARASVEILKDWAALSGFLRDHLDSVTLDMRDAAAIANALSLGAIAGAHTSTREALVAALAACAANGYMPTNAVMHPGDFIREFGTDPAATTPIIAGVPVYPVVGVPLGTVIAGARMAATTALGDSVSFDIGASGDDLSRGLRELTMMRASHFFVRQSGGVAVATVTP